MFGCLAVYVQDKIVLILRDKREGTADNGVWLATTEEHHQSLRRETNGCSSGIAMFRQIASPTRHPTAIKIAVLPVNIAIVAYLLYRIRGKRMRIRGLPEKL
jgi:hypothetical protein